MVASALHRSAQQAVTLLTKVKVSQGSAKVMCEFFLFWQRILTHAYSRVVLRVLEAAVESKKRFSVYVTESQPDQAGQVFINLVFILVNRVSYSYHPICPALRKAARLGWSILNGKCH